jgi:dTDP-L-rhamnose 4-epimerase
MATKVLLTGGAGFIGGHTAAELVRRGYHVRVLDCLDPQIHGPQAVFPVYLPPEVERVQADVCDQSAVRAALRGVDAVFHFAAQTGVGQSMYDMRSYVQTNCTGTASLLEVLVADRIRLDRLVLASSRAVYGEGTHRCPMHGLVFPGLRTRDAMLAGDFGVRCPDCGQRVEAERTAEDRPLSPTSLYGLTKKQQEEYCQYAATVFDLPITILRYFNVYGSHQALNNPYTGVATVFFNRIRGGQPISLYEGGSPLRDFVHVSDVVQANLLALERDVPSGTCLNVGSGEVATIRDLAVLLGRICGIEPRLEDRGEFRVGDIHAGLANISRAEKLIGYRPRKSLAEGLAEFVDWARGQPSVDHYAQTVAELERHGLFGRATTP